MTAWGRALVWKKGKEMSQSMGDPVYQVGGNMSVP